MIVAGSYSFAAPTERVFDLLLDPDVMAAAMPGAQDLKHMGDGRYEGVIKVGVGPVTAAEFSLVVSLKDVRRPAHYAMDIDSKGRFGFTRGAASVDLVETDGGTTMRYRADLQVGGKIAGVGQRLLDSISKLMTKQGLDALSREMERRLRGPDAGVRDPEGAPTDSGPGTP